MRKRTNPMRRTWVRGYRGGRPSYGTMAKNSWPFRKRTKVLRQKRRFRKSKIIQGGFRKSFTLLKRGGKKSAKLASLVGRLGGDRHSVSRGAFTVNLTTAGNQAVVSKVFQRYTSPNGLNGTFIKDEFASMSSTVTGDCIFKKSTFLKYDIVSASNTVSYLDIYDIEYKDNMPYNTDYFYPHEMWRDAIDINFANATSTDYLRAQEPIPPKWPLNQFSQNCRIVKKSRIVLNPGQVHTHTYNRKLNRRFYRANGDHGDEQGGAPATPYDVMKGWTYGTMFVLNSTPVSSIGDSTQVNFGLAKVNITWQHRSIFYQITNATRAINYYPNNDDGLATIADPQVMNDDSGTAGAISKA